jgi:hypothetical protein
MLSGNIVDEFHHVHCLANTGTTKQADLATLGKRTHQVDDLDTGFKQLVCRCLFCVVRGAPVNGITLFFTNLAMLINGVAQHIHNAAQCFMANRHRNGVTGTADVHTTAQAFGLAHGNGAHNTIPQLLLDFQCDVLAAYIQRFVNLGSTVLRKLNVNDRTNDLYNLSVAHL